ncbi:cerebellin-3-like isoform X2 [Mya arenaria]|uniref:cerebellin-3-like isoform X2 n=1 Tax=Mya arenaria TaxID=6604 RepID=UPI0022DF6EFE|nr:cerebellin-3-like isoform X2 [Mya arenaria]
MYYSKCVQEFFIIVLVFDSSLCGMNEPQCFSRFDYDEKMLEKMVRAEIKDEELLGKLEALEQRLVNVENKVDNTVKEIQANMNHSPVAFFATISSSFTTSSSYQTLVFDKVLTDVGGGYKPGTGVFTAPVNGLYVFSASVMVDLSTSASSAHISINKKSSRVVYLFVNDSDGNYETGVGTVILSLQVGDTVKLTCNESERTIFYYSFISGFRL